MVYSDFCDLLTCLMCCWGVSGRPYCLWLHGRGAALHCGVLYCRMPDVAEGDLGPGQDHGRRRGGEKGDKLQCEVLNFHLADKNSARHLRHLHPCKLLVTYPSACVPDEGAARFVSVCGCGCGCSRLP